MVYGIQHGLLLACGQNTGTECTSLSGLEETVSKIVFRFFVAFSEIRDTSVAALLQVWTCIAEVAAL